MIPSRRLAAGRAGNARRPLLRRAGLLCLALAGLLLLAPRAAVPQAGSRPPAKGAKEDSGKAGKPAAPKKSEKGPDKKKADKKDDAEADPAEAEFDKLREQFDAEKAKEPLERVLTIQKFGDHPVARTVPFLEGVLKEEKKTPGIVAAAVLALGKVGTREAVDAVLKLGIPALIGDINMAAVATALSNELDDDAEELVLKNGLSEAVRRNPEAMKLLIEAIAHLRTEKRTPVLLAELRRAPTPGEKIVILHAFRDSPPRDAARAAHGFLRDPDLGVQVAALQVLEAVKAQEYSREYQGLLRAPHWELRAISVDILGALGHPQLVKLLAPLLEDPEMRVRIGVVRALAEKGGDDIMAPLIKALDKNEGRVLDDIADVLSRITGKNFGTNSAQWDSWWSTNKGQVEIARKPPTEFTRLKELEQGKLTSAATYFGLRVLSKNLAFIIDCSDSMSEGYVPLAERKKEEPPPPEEVGKTTAKKKKRPAAGAKAAGPKLTPKIDVAKEELLKVLEHLPQGAKVNVIRFNSLVSAWRPALTALDGGGIADLRQFVQQAAPEGLTNFYAALEEAFKDEKLDTIYLLSDGAPTVGLHFETEDLLGAVMRLNELRKVKINTIGFDLKPEERDLMERLADQNYGVFLFR